MSETHEDPTVTYSVRELLADIKAVQLSSFARVEAKLEGKADKDDISRLEGKVDAHDRYIQGLDQRMHNVEVSQQQTASKEENRHFIRRHRWGIMGTLALIAATIAGPILGALHVFGGAFILSRLF